MSRAFVQESDENLRDDDVPAIKDPLPIGVKNYMTPEGAERLRQELHIPEHLTIRLVVALGKPAERVVLEDLAPGGDIRYWRDEKGNHHVPKRMLEELVVTAGG